jgi:hypothetical protein
MCIPTQLSQPNLSLNDKSTILLRALGALRTLRSHRRITADEAAYRALIVACGKCGTDRRVELMKLFGLMRTDGIFPNAVTLGQYTRAIAEGYSKRAEDAQGKVGMQISVNGTQTPAPFNLDILDNNLQILEGRIITSSSLLNRIIYAFSFSNDSLSHLHYRFRSEVEVPRHCVPGNSFCCRCNILDR